MHVGAFDTDTLQGTAGDTTQEESMAVMQDKDAQIKALFDSRLLGSGTSKTAFKNQDQLSMYLRAAMRAYVWRCT